MGSVGAIQEPEYDAIVLGAGLSGCYSLYRMREQKAKVIVLEAGSSVGGTWYWNRYPGARFDSESYSYGFSWSREVLDEWDWTEHFAPQPETERYVNFICDKFHLRDNMKFNTRVKQAYWLQDDRIWELADEQGRRYTTRFLITGIGVLSNPTLPNVPGVEDFKGTSFHTARWPAEGVDFEGKRVAVIGTGATAIQAIPEIAKTVGQLTVFQRTPNWAVPLHNRKINEEEMQKIREGYPELFKLCQRTRMCFIHDANPTGTWDVTPAEREELWEKLYASPGFGIWVSNFKDMGTDREANALASAFVAKKIRQRVHDPETAESLIPKNHGFGTRRVPMESGYYEAYNRPNVRLVDLHKTPMKSVTASGIETASEQMEFDMIIYATGFDAVTGAFDAIDFRGMDGMKLRDRWVDGPKTYLGMTNQFFPNLFMIMGPHQAFGNIPRSIEYAVGWVSDCIEYLREQGLTWIEARADETKEWAEHVHQIAEGLLSNEVDSWMTGVNHNVPGRTKRIVARYNGSAPEFRERCRQVAERKYETFTLA